MRRTATRFALLRRDWIVIKLPVRMNLRRCRPYEGCHDFANTPWTGPGGAGAKLLRAGGGPLRPIRPLSSGAVQWALMGTGPVAVRRCIRRRYILAGREIDKTVPTGLDVHCIVDNYGSHKHPKVKAWLAPSPRRHVHFIPAYSSWLNHVTISGRWNLCTMPACGVATISLRSSTAASPNRLGSRSIARICALPSSPTGSPASEAR